MVHAYLAGLFDECIAAADRLDEECGASPIATIYRDQAQKHGGAPADHFDGLITLTAK
jgi:hypothetical protein